MTNDTLIDSTVTAAISNAIKAHDLPEAFLDTVDHYFRPLANEIATAAKEAVDISPSPLLLGVFGSQGSGKSTLADFLKLLLSQQLNTSCVVMSLDDFYLTREERNTLAENVHPLLQTRGVPGTHDVSLLRQTVEQLSQCSESNPVRIPIFNKAIDDRAQPSDWQTISTKPKVIILEGWCVGVTPQASSELVTPVNELEKNLDADGTWRRYVNRKLSTNYATLFNQLDKLIALIVPSFDCVHEWRSLQEEKLISALKRSGESTEATMTSEQIGHFIAHYQRLTEHALATLPSYADWCLSINQDHNITELKSRERD